MKRNATVLLLILMSIFCARALIVDAQQVTIPADSIWGLSWSPDSTRIALGRYNGVVDVKNVTSGLVVLTPQSGNSSQLITAAWSPDSSKIAASNGQNSVFIWDSTTGQLLKTLQGQNTTKVGYLAWSPDSSKIAGISENEYLLQTWDASTGTPIYSKGGVGQGLDWFQNKIVVGSGNGLLVIDSTNGSLIKGIGLHKGTVLSVAWSPDGNKIVSSSIDGEIRIWDANLNGSMSSNQPLLIMFGNTFATVSVDWSSDGTRIVTSSLDGTVKVWNAANGILIQTIQNGAPALVAQFSPSGTKLAYGGAGNVVQIINAPTISTPTAVPTATPLAPVVGGIGLLGQYYDNIDLTSWKLTRVDSAINFDWIQGSPAPSIGADTFSIRWTGQVIPQYSQTYTFYTQSDDGVRLWVNNQQVINDWTNHGTTEFSGTIALTAGTRYNIRMEYYDSSSAAVARLYWSSSSQPKQIIPTDRLLPNGRIAFQTNRDGNDEIYSMNADGSSLVNLTGDSGSDTYPATATGTQKIVFSSSRTGDYEIDIMGLIGGTVTNLTQNTSYDQYPSQAPDGRIAFSSTRNGGNFNLYTMNANGTGLTQLTNTTTIAERFSSWSPDGLWIVYEATDSNSVHDLWKIPAAGGTPIRLTQNAGSNTNPEWSPDGTTIVFVSSRDTGGHYIFLMNAGGTNQRPFRTGGLNGFNPTWSADGTSIAYHAWAVNQPDVYTIPVGGTTPTRLTNNDPIDDIYPSWQAQ